MVLKDGKLRHSFINHNHSGDNKIAIPEAVLLEFSLLGGVKNELLVDSFPCRRL